MRGILINPVKGGRPGPYPWDNGLDIHVPVGTAAVMAALSGTVEYAEEGHCAQHTGLYGVPTIQVRIRLDHPILWQERWIDAGGRTVQTSGLIRRLWYAHLHDAVVSAGQRVKQGDLIDHTEGANGVPHLHFGLVGDDITQNVTPDPFDLARYLFRKELPPPAAPKKPRARPVVLV